MMEWTHFLQTLNYSLRMAFEWHTFGICTPILLLHDGEILWFVGLFKADFVVCDRVASAFEETETMREESSAKHAFRGKLNESPFR
jgi:hypothetical protein